MNDTTILITTFNRDCLLQLGLESIRKFHNDVGILVLNDGDAGNVENICKHYSADYLFTGKNKHAQWRVPGFALNIGIKQTSSDIVFLSCAEMWHVTDCITPMVAAIHKDKMTMAIPEGKDDDGRYLNNLGSPIAYNECVKLKTELPFLLAVRREHLLAINGYDEDFAGQSFDDDDIIERLQKYGCHYAKLENAKCVHLYHPRYCHDKRAQGRWAYNKKLYEERKNIIVRNQGREWGKL